MFNMKILGFVQYEQLSKLPDKENNNGYYDHIALCYRIMPDIIKSTICPISGKKDRRGGSTKNNTYRYKNIRKSLMSYFFYFKLFLKCSNIARFSEARE